MEFIQRSERWLQLEDLDSEVWRDVVGYENLYEVSNYGRVRTNKYKTTSSARFSERHWKQRIIKQKFQQRCRSEKYDARVILWKDGKEKTHLVSRLVAIAFIDNPYNLPQINHIDGEPTNNNVKNLEWCDSKYNNEHARDNNLNNTSIKVKLINKNTNEEIIFDSMSKASLFMNKNIGYINCRSKRGKNENDDFKWELIKN